MRISKISRSRTARYIYKFNCCAPPLFRLLGFHFFFARARARGDADACAGDGHGRAQIFPRRADATNRRGKRNAAKAKKTERTPPNHPTTHPTNQPKSCCNSQPNRPSKAGFFFSRRGRQNGSSNSHRGPFSGAKSRVVPPRAFGGRFGGPGRRARACGGPHRFCCSRHHAALAHPPTHPFAINQKSELQ